MGRFWGSQGDHKTLQQHTHNAHAPPNVQAEDDELTILTTQGTSDVRVDPQLNKKVWEQGVKGVPYRLRVRISRRRNDEEGAKEKLYSYVQAVNVKNPKGLLTSNVDEEEA